MSLPRRAGTVTSDDSRRSATTAWLEQRASGPLSLCAAGLCVLGLVGLTIVNPTNSTHARVAAPIPPATKTIPLLPPAPAQGSGGGPIIIPAPGSPVPSGGAGASNGAGANLIVTTPTTAAPPAIRPPVVTASVPSKAVATVKTTSPPQAVAPVHTFPVSPPSSVAPKPPVLQVSLNAGVATVNVGLGPNSCTGVNLLGIKLGCTNAPAGLTLGGSLLGAK